MNPQSPNNAISEAGWLDYAQVVHTPHYSGRQGKVVDLVVLHHTGGGHDVAERTARWFASEASKVSAHFVVGGDGTVVQCVSVDNSAWHAGESRYHGRPDVNRHSIGIELANDGKSPFPEAQLAALERLLQVLEDCVFVERPYELVGHREVCIPLGRKPDPHDGFPIRRFRPSLPRWTNLQENLQGNLRPALPLTPFQKEFREFLDRHGHAVYPPAIPDYILAEFLDEVFMAFTKAVQRRNEWAKKR